MEKLFETFSRGAISNEQAVKICPVRCTRAAISRAYGAYFSLLLPRPARGKRGRIERWRKHRFFFTPCWKSTNISSAARIFHEFNSERNGYPRFALQPCNRCVFLLHISDIQLLRIVRIDLLIHNLCSLNKYLTDKVNFFYTFF